MTKLHTLTALLAVAILSTGCSKAENPKPESKPEASATPQPSATPAPSATTAPSAKTVTLGENLFPIWPWTYPEKGRFGDRCAEIYGLIAAGGCNVVKAPVSDLDACQTAGLKVLVDDPRVHRGDIKTVTQERAEKDFLSLLHDINNHPAVVGFFVGDEPTTEMFRGLEIQYRLIEKYAPEKVGVLGLFPNVADPLSQLKADDYETYVRDFVKTCRPRIFGYDHYDLTESKRYPSDTYWQNLETFRKISAEEKIPFFVWVGCGAFGDQREQSAADMRFEVFSVLAYGAKGIGLFPFLSIQVDAGRAEPIDGFGKPSPFFYEMQLLNKRLQLLGPELLPLRCDAVYHYTTFGVPAGSRTLAEGDLLKSIKVNKKEYRLLIGEFTHRDTGARYLMIVNCDLDHTVTVAPELATPARDIYYFEPYLGKYIDFAAYNGIAPGDGRLIKVIPK